VTAERDPDRENGRHDADGRGSMTAMQPFAISHEIIIP
jgi:hypothetical protein